MIAKGGAGEYDASDLLERIDAYFSERYAEEEKCSFHDIAVYLGIPSTKIIGICRGEIEAAEGVRLALVSALDRVSAELETGRAWEGNATKALHLLKSAPKLQAGERGDFAEGEDRLTVKFDYFAKEAFM